MSQPLQRIRKLPSAVIAARSSAEGAEHARDQARYDAAEAALDHSAPPDWPSIFEARRAARNDAADAAYRERLADYESAEPDANWLVEDIIRWNAERGVRLPAPGEAISDEQYAFASALFGALADLPDMGWKPDPTARNLDLNSDPYTAPRASRELADRVTRYFAENPPATYAMAARALNTTPPAITACKRRLLDDARATRIEPPAWVLRERRGRKHKAQT